MIPKFSIRHILFGMVALAFLSLCMASAARGNRVAYGVSVAIIGSFIPFCIYAIVHWGSFVLAYIPAMILGGTSSNGVLPSDVPAPVNSEFENGSSSDSIRGRNDTDDSAITGARDDS